MRFPHEFGDLLKLPFFRRGNFKTVENEIDWGELMLVNVGAEKGDAFLALREGRAVHGIAVYTGVFLVLFFMDTRGEAQGKQTTESKDFFHLNKLQ